MPMLITLALGLVAAGAVTRVLMKIAAAPRAAVMIDHPDSDRVDDQWRPDRHNDQELGFVDEPQEDEPVISAVSNEESRRPSRGMAGECTGWQHFPDERNQRGYIGAIEFGIFTKPYSPMAAGPGI